MTTLLVITGLVPVIPITRALRFSKRDGRDKAGHDVVGLTPAVILPVLRTGPASRRRGKGIVFKMWRAFPSPLRGGGGVGVAGSKLAPSSEKLEG